MGSQLIRQSWKHFFRLSPSRYSSNLSSAKSHLQKESNYKSIDEETIKKLEKLSLVKFDDKKGIKTLKEAVEFANKLREIEVPKDIEPMYSVLETESLELRSDVVFEGDCRKEVLQNASEVEDGYFVSPAGNTPKSS